jgi:outer membrane protein TolC
LTRKSLEETQKVYDLTVVQEQAGTSPKGDVLRASIDVANAKQALLVAEGNEETALIAFNTLLAKSPKEVAVLTEDILNEGSLPKGPLAPTEELVRMATGNRPAIKASVESVKAANFGVRQAESTRLPDLNVQYERSTVQQLDALSFTLSLPLFDFGSIRESVRAAKENRKQVEAQKRSTESQVAQQVSQARSDLDIALKSAKSYRTEILEPSAKLFEMANLGYQNGATGILPVIDASSTLRNARVGYIGTLLAIHKAEDELNASIGNSRFLSVIRPGVK